MEVSAVKELRSAVGEGYRGICRGRLQQLTKPDRKEFPICR
jgi:hypothetical protein